MSLIKSISGIRGTIGGQAGENLTPLDILKFSTAYGIFIKNNGLFDSGQTNHVGQSGSDQINFDKKAIIIVGRDARISGEMVKDLVIGALLSQGLDVIDLGLATTPTVEMTVIKQKAQGGIIITASHNPQGWNALKFLNHQGEFLSAEEGNVILELAEDTNLEAVTEEKIGKYEFNERAADEHIKAILDLSLVKQKLIAERKFKIVVDGINSVGGTVIPELLRALGVNDIVELNCVPNGQFAHKPEPLDENLNAIKALVLKEKADLGIVVDPDVDRLAFIDEQGKMFGEEYTLVAVAEYVLKNYCRCGYQKISVSNLSSSRALRDITEKRGGAYYAAAVGEVNVVQKMKETAAAIGGEGNGGIIYPELHCGRDALVGVALFLSFLAEENKKMSEFKKQFPEYFMVKDRIDLIPGINLVELLNKIKQDYLTEKITEVDGLKIDWPDSWVHLRASNTEPIIRIYAEARQLELAREKVEEIKKKISANIK